MILDYTLAIEALADGRKPSMKLSFLSASIEDKIESIHRRIPIAAHS